MAESQKPQATKPVSIVCVGMAGKFLHVNV